MAELSATLDLDLDTKACNHRAWSARCIVPCRDSKSSRPEGIVSKINIVSLLENMIQPPIPFDWIRYWRCVVAGRLRER